MDSRGGCRHTVCDVARAFWLGEFLIVEIGLLHDNRVPRFGGQSTINIHQSTMAYWAVD